MTCVADLQDPPELIPQFVKKWEEGYKVVIGVKQGSHDSWLMARTRKAYYWLVAKLSSDVELVHNFTGFGLYDREVIEQFRTTDEQYPYFRGLVGDFGYERAEIPYLQPARTRGKTKNNFFSLYDIAMLGITNHSKVPLRIATMAGFALSILSLLVALVYLILKLAWWDTSTSAWRPSSSASTSSARSSCSSSGCWASTSARSTPRSTNDRWWWRRSASTSTDPAGPAPRGARRGLRRQAVAPGASRTGPFRTPPPREGAGTCGSPPPCRRLAWQLPQVRLLVVGRHGEQRAPPRIPSRAPISAAASAPSMSIFTKVGGCPVTTSSIVTQSTS